MSRYLVTIKSKADKERAARILAAAPAGTRVEFKAAKRTLPQNSLMWGLLSDVAMQKQHCGRRYTPDQWKALFMHACGQEVQFMPSLDCQSFVPWGQRSSDLSKQEMTDLIEFVLSWGAQNGVTFRHMPEVEHDQAA